ncbi:MAG: hypothetical protein ACKV2V_15845 [Blastocatellia bacterium]
MRPETALLLIRIGGFANLAWMIFHLFFWRIFEWRSELRRISFINRNVVQILNLCLSFCFLFFAAVSLRHAEELIRPQPNIGHTVLSGIAIFWIMRLAEQPLFFRFSPASNIFCLLFALTSACYALPWALL